VLRVNRRHVEIRMKENTEIIEKQKNRIRPIKPLPSSQMSVTVTKAGTFRLGSGRRFKQIIIIIMGIQYQTWTMQQSFVRRYTHIFSLS